MAKKKKAKSEYKHHKTKRLKMRQWLNPREGCYDTGAICTVVNGTLTMESGKFSHANVGGHLQIRDCSRQIELNFAVEVYREGDLKKFKKELKERRKKLDIIRLHLDTIEEGFDDMEALMKKHGV